MVICQTLDKCLRWAGSHYAAEQKIVINIIDKQITFKVGSNDVVINSVNRKISAPVFVEQGSAQVPLFILMEALGIHFELGNHDEHHHH